MRFSQEILKLTSREKFIIIEVYNILALFCVNIICLEEK